MLEPFNREDRKAVIDFFTDHCGNKLNKNLYFEGFYKMRNAENIWKLLKTMFIGTELESCSLAQQYYHLFWDPITNTAIEVKPLSLTDTEQNICKFEGLRVYCEEKSYNFKIVTERDIFITP